MNNINLPPIPIAVSTDFLYNKPRESFEFGHLISCRGLINQAYQFSVLLESGALYTGLPLDALKPLNKFPGSLELKDVQPFDVIDDGLELIQLKTLYLVKCSVKLFNGESREGRYHFSIDHTGNGLSRHPRHWKQLHFIELDSGDFVLYPQYRIRFLDRSLCDLDKPLPDYSFNESHWISE